MYNKQTKWYKNIMMWIWLIVFGYSAYLMAEITWRYRFFDMSANFLQIKQTEMEGIWWYRFAFYTHVCAAIFALPAGFTQFSTRILQRWRRVHRNIGYSYVVAILLFAAPSGILIGLEANGGMLAQFSFVLLGLLWFFFTAQAVRCIRLGNIEAHRRYMIRSFALTCSALTLRYWKVILVYFLQPHPMDLYQIIAWIGWVPNLIIAEIIINKKLWK